MKSTELKHLTLLSILRHVNSLKLMNYPQGDKPANFYKKLKWKDRDTSTIDSRVYCNECGRQHKPSCTSVNNHEENMQYTKDYQTTEKTRDFENSSQVLLLIFKMFVKQHNEICKTRDYCCCLTFRKLEF